MERGVKLLTRIMAVALLMGAAVILLHPDYRDTFRAMWWGDIEDSAIWMSNRGYYSEVVHDMEAMYEVAE